MMIVTVRSPRLAYALPPIQILYTLKSHDYKIILTGSLLKGSKMGAYPVMAR